jgi:hypothetical protein
MKRSEGKGKASQSLDVVTQLSLCEDPERTVKFLESNRTIVEL